MPYVYALLNLFDLTCAEKATAAQPHREWDENGDANMPTGKEMDTTNIDIRQKEVGFKVSGLRCVCAWVCGCGQKQNDEKTGGHVAAMQLPVFTLQEPVSASVSVFPYIPPSHLIFKLLVVKISHVLLWQFIF